MPDIVIEGGNRVQRRNAGDQGVVLRQGQRQGINGIRLPVKGRVNIGDGFKGGRRPRKSGRRARPHGRVVNRANIRIFWIPLPRRGIQVKNIDRLGRGRDIQPVRSRRIVRGRGHYRRVAPGAGGQCNAYEEDENE